MLSATAGIHGLRLWIPVFWLWGGRLTFTGNNALSFLNTALYIHRNPQLEMGTSLEITNLRHDQKGDIHLPQDDQFQSLTLSQEFLYEIIVNDEVTKILSPQEVDLISPNWGEITLTSTDTLSSEKRETYLRLLTEVIQTNSRQSLTQFLVAEEILRKC